MLETNIDDMNTEIYSYIMPKLFKEGALDVYYTNIMMKKNRPGVKVSVLCHKDKCSVLENILFMETSTFGIRKLYIEREVLEREYEKVNTKFGELTVKIALKDEKIIKYAPEYEECKRYADKIGLPLRKIYEEVIKCFEEPK